MEQSERLSKENLMILKPKNPIVLSKFVEKVKEYKERLRGYENTSSQDLLPVLKDAYYKKVILETILQQGLVDPSELSEKLRKEDSRFNPDIFYVAYKVINAYCTGKEKEISGGVAL